MDFEDRPFSTLDEMHDGIIKAWNSVVKKTDTVYHLGDFSFGKASEWIDILDQLKGNIILIKGNHDKSKIIKKVINEGFLQEYYEVGTIIKADKYIFNLSHYPMMIGVRMNNFSVHGHIHEYDTGFLNNLNIGVDSTFARSLGLPFGAPIELSEIVKYFTNIAPQIEEEFEKQRGI